MIPRNTAILTAVLVAQAFLYHGASRWEQAPKIAPLARFPYRLGEWETVREAATDPAILAVLKADDTLNRVYADPASGESASLMLAFFRTQRASQAPHSPKNCLPGAGYEPVEAGYLDVAVPGEPRPIRINRYVVVRGEERNVVLYWYQSNGRIIASEYAAKLWLVLDSIRYHRSDTALVRLVIPSVDGQDAAATATGVRLVQRFFPPLARALSPTL